MSDVLTTIEGFAICPWCRRPLPHGRRHGSERRFCCPTCRHAFQTAARRYGMLKYEQGAVSIAELKRISATTEIGRGDVRPGVDGETTERVGLDAPQRSARASGEASQ
jgi:hypothetical protein